MKDSGVEWIGEIPENWNFVKVKYVYEIKKAKLPTEFFDDKTLNPYLSMEYIRDSSNVPQYAKDGTYCEEEDLLLLWDGSNAGEIIFDHPAGYAPSTTAILKLRVEQNAFFLKYYMKFLETELRKNRNGMGIPHVDGNFLKNAEIVIPSLTSQQKIAVFLDEKVGEIDFVIRKTKETIEDYKKYRQAIITDATTKGLNLTIEMKESKLPWVDFIPQHWSERKILHIISMPVIDGPHVSPELVDDGVPYISADAIENGKIDFNRKRGFITKEYSKECNKRYKPQKDDILVVKLGASTGKIAIVGDNTNFNIWVPLAVVRCRADIFSKYVFYSMESTYFKNEIRNGWTFGTQETLGVRTLEQLKIFVPPLEEQKQIAEYLDEKCYEIDKLVSEKEKLLIDLDNYKKSLIYECVTGKQVI
ncbi:MAG: restriction endonuclease subunit S [Eubacterium sp.]|nr:restriction endonuclease subunit S [Eubacterium sp.]